MRSLNNLTILDSRIGILKRRIDTSLMELTEAELRINARVPSERAGEDELENARLALTAAIVAMDAELKQLRLTRVDTETHDASLSSSDEIDHSVFSRGISVQKPRDDDPFPSATKAGEVVCFGDTKPNLGAVTVETAPLGRPDYKPAGS